MVNVRKILVPKDFSECSADALTYAIDMARRYDASLTTLFAEVLHGESYSEQDTERSSVEMEERLGRLVEASARRRSDYEPEALSAHHVVTRDVAPAPAIIRYVEENDIDLVVMGTHGRRGLSRIFLGSVATEVVRLAPCSVMTVRCREVRAEAHISFKSILVPVDFSVHSANALKTAIDLARVYNARLDLLHVVEDRLHPAFYNTGIFSIYDIQPDINERAQHHLEQFLREQGGEGVEAGFYVKPGQAAHTIVTFAESSGSDLIVMSTHGLTGMTHFLIGSVTEKVVRAAPCPVWTRKATGLSGQD